MENELAEKTIKAKEESEAKNEELRRQILQEQRERNQVAFENDKLCRDFEALKAKVKETMETQDQQKVQVY